MNDITEKDRFRRSRKEVEHDGKVWQKRLEWDASDFSGAELADEMMTSMSDVAQPVSGKGSVVVLTRDQVKWLNEKTAELLVHWAAHG